ncbi:hypothetical protein OWR29_05315 [Actinoplanes sp. Pm04-4]|jgi:hypothetical protein|uniref:Lipoprotein n=1 Tax=Paractinoplanes pyxinae TaxID=2997416 RepID=A0ABT4AT36_9ACTN|nr:hypothetical protein [Actinoplanes pyxinae]MCY1137411.1 hypothetical protein [Actinoplanes pyxinae]
MRPARPLALVALLALLASLAGCSGSPGARAWAASVCTTLEPWRTEIGSLTTRTQQQMEKATTPGQAKENLMRLFGGAAEASEKARAGVVKAGVPDVDDGARIADGFTGSLAATRDAYARAKTGIEGLATAPAEAFYQQVTKVVEQMQADYAASSLDTSNLNSVELKAAFDEAPECR